MEALHAVFQLLHSGAPARADIPHRWADVLAKVEFWREACQLYEYAAAAHEPSGNLTAARYCRGRCPGSQPPPGARVATGSSGAALGTMLGGRGVRPAPSSDKIARLELSLEGNNGRDAAAAEIGVQPFSKSSYQGNEMREAGPGPGALLESAAAGGEVVYDFKGDGDAGSSEDPTDPTSVAFCTREQTVARRAADAAASATGGAGPTRAGTLAGHAYLRSAAGRCRRLAGPGSAAPMSVVNAFQRLDASDPLLQMEWGRVLAVAGRFAEAVSGVRDCVQSSYRAWAPLPTSPERLSLQLIPDTHTHVHTHKTPPPPFKYNFLN